MERVEFTVKTCETPRHRTAYIEAGPPDGPLLIFVHGWPAIGIFWRAQLEYFSALGWRCIAPDMRGYGGSSIPTATSAYAVREFVHDLCDLHDAVGGAPAVWVGHDWGSPPVWALATHHSERCRAVANLCVPHLPRGFTLESCVPLVDRSRYPIDEYPVGQWDYFLFYRENFTRAALDFEADVAATLGIIYRRAPQDANEKRSTLAEIRKRGGWFGAERRARAVPRDTTLISDADFNALVYAFTAGGFSGPDAWYMNDAANVAFAGDAPRFGRLTLPVLFVHAARDNVCETVRSRLAMPMRDACSDLTEATIDAGHWVSLECPTELNGTLERWLRRSASAAR